MRLEVRERKDGNHTIVSVRRITRLEVLVKAFFQNVKHGRARRKQERANKRTLRVIAKEPSPTRFGKRPKRPRH